MLMKRQEVRSTVVVSSVAPALLPGPYALVDECRNLRAGDCRLRKNMQRRVYSTIGVLQRIMLRRRKVAATSLNKGFSAACLCRHWNFLFPV
jgi:hypothetical protein